MAKRKSYTKEFENRLKERTMIIIAFLSTIISMLLAWGFFEQDNLPASVVLIINVMVFVVHILNFITENVFEWNIASNPIIVIGLLFWTYFSMIRFSAKKAKESFDIKEM